TPVKSSAGKATKLPPPATALMAPPRAPAAQRKSACEVSKENLLSRIWCLGVLGSAGAAILGRLLPVLTRHSSAYKNRTLSGGAVQEPAPRSCINAALTSVR